MDDILQELFTNVLNMSITATYIAIAVIIIRFFVLKRMPKIFSYALWATVLIRLVCPISFSSAFSFLNLLSPNIQTSKGTMEYIPHDLGLMQSPAVDVGINNINNIVNTSLPAPHGAMSANPMQILMFICTYIWAAGVMGLLLYSVISYIKVLNRVRTATLLTHPIVSETLDKVGMNRKIPVYVTDRIAGPFVCGLMKPKVYLPVTLSEKELSYILMHEFVHIKRFDYLVKPFAFMVLIFHWFNPVLWLSFVLMGKDMEMSCDEKVMAILGSDIKDDYSHSLLLLAVGKNRLLSGSPLAFGESSVKSRIKNVLRYKKPAFWIGVMTLILTTVLGFAFLANPGAMIENFLPERIEIIIDDEMRNIVFQNNDRNVIAELLRYDAWDKANMQQYDLSTTTYISDGANKVIGIYDAADDNDNTYFKLSAGFGIHRKKWYKAPPEVYDMLETYIRKHYVSPGQTPGKLSVDEFIALYTDYLKQNDSVLQYPPAEEPEKVPQDAPTEHVAYYDITPENVYEEIGCQIFKVNHTCESYIAYGNNIIPIGRGFGGWGLVDVEMCDFDHNGQKDLLYTYSWGSGMHRSHIGIFNFTAMQETTLDFVHMNNDMMLEMQPDGTFNLYEALVEAKDLLDYTHFDLKKGDFLGSIVDGKVEKAVDESELEEPLEEDRFTIRAVPVPVGN